MNSYVRATFVVAAFWLLPVGQASAHETKAVLGQSLITDAPAGQATGRNLKVGVVDMEKVYADYVKLRNAGNRSAGERTKPSDEAGENDAMLRDLLENMSKFKKGTNDNKGAPKP